MNEIFILFAELTTLDPEFKQKSDICPVFRQVYVKTGVFEPDRDKTFPANLHFRQSIMTCLFEQSLSFLFSLSLSFSFPFYSNPVSGGFDGAGMPLRVTNVCQCLD